MKSTKDRAQRRIEAQDVGLRMQAFLSDPVIAGTLDRIEQAFMAEALAFNTLDDQRRAAAVSVQSVRALRNVMLKAVAAGERAAEKQSQSAEGTIQ